MTYKANMQIGTCPLPSAVTLSTTLKALFTDTDFPLELQDSFFNRVGNKIKIRLFGKMTTGATPGNLTITVKWGNGDDNNGTSIASSAALALSTGQTDVSFLIEVNVTCMTIGATGTLLTSGIAFFNNAVLATSLQPMLIPATALAVSGSLDLNSAFIPSIQAMRSGNTAETMTVVDMEVLHSSGGLHFARASN